MKNKSTFFWIWRICAGDNFKIIVITLLQMLLGGSGVLSAWLMKGIIDCAVQKSTEGFWYYGGAFTALVIAQILSRAALSHFSESCHASLENRFKRRLFGALMTADYGSVKSVHGGEWLNRLTSDTKVVAEGMTDIFSGACGMAVKLVGAVVMIMVLLPGLWLPVTVGGVFLVFFPWIFRKKLKALHKEVQESDGELRSSMTEQLEAMLVIRAFGKQGFAENEAAEKMSAHKDSRMKRSIFSNLCHTGFGVAINAAYVLGVLVCGYGILSGTMTYGSFTAVLQLIAQIQTPFASLSGFVPRFYSMLASGERLMEAENYPKDCPKTVLTEEEAKKLYENFEHIEFRNVEFSYPGDSLFAVKNLSLSIKKGDYVAFTGPSGSGKSTVLKLMLALYPLEHGEQLIKAGGEEQMLTAEHRTLFAFVPQGNMLMSGNIREVLTFGDTSVSESEIWKALELACASDFVNQLEQKLDTKLSERGSGLSEGQMQRLAIARAILSDRPILLFDEATSALDEATEAKVLENLRAMTDKTVAIVTHRPAALAICDREVSFG